MPTDSAGHDLTRRDNADAPPCPMERLADRMVDTPAPKWLKRFAERDYHPSCWFELKGRITRPDQIDDLINFLARVKG